MAPMNPAILRLDMIQTLALALVERYGLTPRAFLVIPMVGAFFIDLTNALIITAYINLVT